MRKELYIFLRARSGDPQGPSAAKVTVLRDWNACLNDCNALWGLLAAIQDSLFRSCNFASILIDLGIRFCCPEIRF